MRRTLVGLKSVDILDVGECVSVCWCQSELRKSDGFKVFEAERAEIKRIWIVPSDITPLQMDL